MTSNKGKIVVIGGNLSSEKIYEKIIEFGGGPDKTKVAIIPASSYTPAKTGDEYKNEFIKMGVKKDNIWIVPIAVLDDENTPEIDESLWIENGKDPQLADKIKQYNVIFFVGGDQTRYTKTLLTTNGDDLPMLKAIREVYFNGGIIAGTSAGAIIHSDSMIGGGSSYGSTVIGVVYDKNKWGDYDNDSRLFLTKGLGFIENAITDTHFVKRGRLGRLITACIVEKKSMGYGVGEDTAFVIDGNLSEVIGTGGVIIADTSDIELVYKTPEEGPLYAKNIKVHYLEHKDKYNLKTKEIIINKIKKPTTDYPNYDEKDYKISSDIFGQYKIAETITKSVVDNKTSEGLGLALDDDNEDSYDNIPDNSELGTKGIGMSTLLRFRQEKETQGYYGILNIDREHQEERGYSVTNIYVDIFPLKVVKDYGCSDRGLSLLLFPLSDGIEVRVFDKNNGKPIYDATIKIKNDDTRGLLGEMKTDAFGRVLIPLSSTEIHYRFDVYRDPDRYMILDSITLSKNLTYSRNMNAIFCYVP